MKTVFIDVDTQLDFVVPSGALYVPGAERLIPVWTRLREQAAAAGITIVSTVDAHDEDDPEFAAWPPHCVLGTLGQRKPEGLTCANPHMQRTQSHVPAAWPDGAPAQIVVHKKTTDCFAEPNFVRVLELLNADRYAVYGVATEVCVRHALRGLLGTGKKVDVLTDAIRELDAASGSAAIREFQAAGGGTSTIFA